ncbi:nuclear transport factor 2 family protein [Mycobacterium sp. PSTR-4-N]|uniref:nuclear transport factor 2 family protein n=1 Tax=Mycobacterium sp. PSTR-4-N TaxID=2917745 RepID=UPI001F14EA34|nr:nuclear transport factor 2 family protein [Mycobacterium sp. PSTR-4-N]MCG7596399.1 nuclear transport factor 2 family protein [Mycobacterium sp. PSTR-4-N]
MTENASAETTMTPNTAAADAALAVWLTMWNSGGEIARRICTDDFRIHFLNSEADGSNPGDDVLGAQSFARYLDAYRERHPEVVFTEVARAVDGVHGRMLWNVRAGENAAGGVDVFDFTDDGLIREVWSVGGTRTHRT